MTDKKIKRIATAFFYWWHNTPGTNTMEGFDMWWRENKWKYSLWHRVFGKLDINFKTGKKR